MTSPSDWWAELRHGGLLLDRPRLEELCSDDPPALLSFREPELRRLIDRLHAGGLERSEFVTAVLTKISPIEGGTWKRGSDIPASWTRHGLAGESLRPQQLWQGQNGALLPVFIDKEEALGIGRGRRAVSHVLQWLRAGSEQLAVLSNGKRWRLVFAGLDFDAWCEWDTELWFAEGKPSPQLEGLRQLLWSRHWIPPAEGQPNALLAAILASRRGQSELSRALGERVRLAVETLIRSHGPALSVASGLDSADVYRAAVRMVMRMVVVLFAEARGLLPQDKPLWHDGYGLGGLREDLDRAAARHRAALKERFSAWPRVLALFGLIHDGCSHPDIAVPAYGGELFAEGTPTSEEGVARAVHLFETACFHFEHLVSDADVADILDLIGRTHVKIRQGRGTTTVKEPINFSDLSSEYIGILYEGLLDFELRRAPEDDPMVFVAVGNQPALPLRRLEEMNDAELKGLFEKLKKEARKKADEGEDDNEDEELEDDEEEEPEEAAEPAEPVAESVPVPQDEGAAQTARRRALEWAKRAVTVASLVPKSRGRMTPERALQHEQRLAEAAQSLLARVVLPGEWYLVRWGGTRKGSGTFYTRPGLAIPTTHRTLRPLAYDPPLASDGRPDLDAHPAAWTPKKPEAILALKVVDPASGSGSFPIAALRFLTEALFESLNRHGRIRDEGDRSVVALLEGKPGDEPLSAELWPARPDDDRFEHRLKAILKRHVVERCLYAVDLDPLAVELCRLALWIETMDRELPFSFLEHKVRCGNALVGAWFDRFRHYPVMAWARDAGDKSHPTSVHFPAEAETKALKVFLKDVVLPDLVHCLDGALPLPFEGAGALNPAKVHDDLRAQLERMHALGPHQAEERKVLYEAITGSSEYQRLQAAFDIWCALWFWPVEHLDLAPLPAQFGAPKAESLAFAAKIARANRFFHWELEFPDVFTASGSGFDAVLGNPPWDISKPSSKEWFSNRDPLYRTYGKQEALRRQRELFTDDKAIEGAWLEYCDEFKAMSNWVSTVAFPFGERTDEEGTQELSLAAGRRGRNAADESRRRHEKWAKLRSVDAGYADPEHPFRHQGSADINLYKTFLEVGLVLLEPDGRLGMIAPSGIYTDHGTTALRKLLIDRNRWEWVFGFENRERIFEIHRSFKFNPILVQKGGRTESIRTAFMQRSLDDWAPGNGERLAVRYSREQVERFSPKSRVILEIRSPRDLEVLEKIYANSVLLGDDGPKGWGIRYSTEFHMTNDSNLFPPRTQWETRGYKPDEYSRWLKGEWRPLSELLGKLGTRSGAPARTDAAPPYDKLPISRADIPAGYILSRDCTEWIHEDEITEVPFADPSGRPLVITIGRGKSAAKLDVSGPAIALPLYEGRMIGQLDFSRKGWVSGKGRASVWREIPWSSKVVEPQFLMGARTWELSALAQYLDFIRETQGKDAYQEQLRRLVLEPEEVRFRRPTSLRVSFMDIASATNRRTMIATAVWPAPCGNKTPILTSSMEADTFAGVLDSFAHDFVVRARCGGLTLNWFVVKESALPARTSTLKHIARLTSGLGCCASVFAGGWSRLEKAWRSVWSVTDHERLRRRSALDAVVAELYGLDRDDLAWILRDCDHPLTKSTDKAFTRTLDPKSFWRVDKEKHPELRHTVLALVAFDELKKLIAELGDRDRAIVAFCGERGGPLGEDGWLIPETLRLADYELGHDERAKERHPVASVLGPRFYSWQVSQNTDESWRECQLHARNLLGEEGFRRLKAEASGVPPSASREPASSVTTASAANPALRTAPPAGGGQGMLF